MHVKIHKLMTKDMVPTKWLIKCTAKDLILLGFDYDELELVFARKFKARMSLKELVDKIGTNHSVPSHFS